jgi:hypothetical protein
MGSSSAGGADGSNTIDLSHNHGGSTGNGSVTWQSSTVNTNFTNPTVPAHYHSTGGGGTLTAAGQSHSGSKTGILREPVALGNRGITRDTGSNGASLGNPHSSLGDGSSYYYTSIDISHTHSSSSVSGSIGNTSGSNGNSSFSTTGGAASFNKNVLNTNQTAHSHSISGDLSSSQSILPQYLSTFYIVRVF